MGKKKKAKSKPTEAEMKEQMLKAFFSETKSFNDEFESNYPALAKILKDGAIPLRFTDDEAD